MKIKLVSVGKIRESYIIAGIQEYTKRLQAYTKLELIRVADERIPDVCSFALQEQIKQKESQRVIDKIKKDEFVIVLDVQGEMLDSIELSQKMEQCMIQGKSTITFVIGGSLGHGSNLLERADFRLSFSKMTFPHPLMQLISLEQIYRSFKIMHQETYHK